MMADEGSIEEDHLDTGSEVQVTKEEHEILTTSPGTNRPPHEGTNIDLLVQTVK